ncbi:hypothetical protein CRYUN_Cryun39dG0074300 [Craigia yunnanensis]
MLHCNHFAIARSAIKKEKHKNIFIIMPSLNTISTPTKKHQCFKQKRMIARKSVRKRIRRLKIEMEERRKQQESIKEGQRQVQEKFEAIEEECEQLRKETDEMIKQSAFTQIRLAFMFNIVKAREEGNFAKASHLTQLLRLV